MKKPIQVTLLIIGRVFDMLQILILMSGVWISKNPARQMYILLLLLGLAAASAFLITIERSPWGWRLMLIRWMITVFGCIVSLYHLDGSIHSWMWLTLFSYLLFCLPTRAYSGIGRAPERWEEKRMVVGEKICAVQGRTYGDILVRLSTRLQGVYSTLDTSVLTATKTTDGAEILPECMEEDMEQIFLEAAESWELEDSQRMEAGMLLTPRLVHISAAGETREELLKALKCKMPLFLREKMCMERALKKVLWEAWDDLSGYARFPRCGRGGEDVIFAGNAVILSVTLRQAEDLLSLVASAKLRINGGE